MQNTDTTEWIICANCKKSFNDWYCCDVENMLTQQTCVVYLCVECIDILSLLLDIDLKKDKEGIFSVSHTKGIQPVKKDNN